MILPIIVYAVRAKLYVYKLYKPQVYTVYAGTLFYITLLQQYILQKAKRSFIAFRHPPFNSHIFNANSYIILYTVYNSIYSILYYIIIYYCRYIFF